MRITVALVISMAFVSFSSVSVAGSKQQMTEGAKASLKEILIKKETDSWNAWQQRDGAFFETFLSDDHVEVGVAGPATKSTIVAGVKSPSCVVKSFALDSFALTVFDANTALLTYHAQQNTTCGVAPVPSPVWTSSLYVQRGGHWLNALYQQTRALK